MKKFKAFFDKKPKPKTPIEYVDPIPPDDRLIEAKISYNQEERALKELNETIKNSRNTK